MFFKTKVFLIFAAMCVGGFSIQQLIPYYAFLGQFGGIRYWITLLVPLVLFAEAMNKGSLSIDKGLPKVWMLSFCLLHGYLFCSQMWSESSIQFLTNEVPDLVLLVLLVLVSACIVGHSPKESTKLLYLFFLLASGILTLVGFIAFGELKGDMLDIGLGGIGNARVQSTAVIAAVYFWIKTNKIYWLIPLPILVTNIFSTGSRAAVLALVVALIVFLLSAWSKTSFLKKMFTVLSMVSLFFGAIQVPAFEKATSAFISSIWTSHESNSQLYFADRDIIFSQAWTLFLQHPITGLGFGGYSNYSLTGEVYPHNLVLNIADDAGILGLMIFGVLIFSLGTRGFRRTSLENRAAFSTGLFYFIASLFSGTYYDARFMWLFFLLYMMPDHEYVPHAEETAKVKNQGAVKAWQTFNNS